MYDHMILTALDYLVQVQKCASSSEVQPQGKTEAGAQLFCAGSFPPIKIRLPDGPENTPSNSETVDELIQDSIRCLRECMNGRRRQMQ